MIYEKSGELNGHEYWEEQLQDCPDCGCDQFYEGPHGGCSVNYKCAICGSEFNEMGKLGFHRINERR